MSPEALVFKLLSESNKPCNVQGVADMLATQGVKKTQAEKALLALAQKGKVRMKEFGKTKIFFRSQEGLPELDPDEKAKKMKEIKELSEKVKAADDVVNGLKRELAAANAALTTKEMHAKFEELQRTAESLDKKLAVIRGNGGARISASEVARTEALLSKYVKEWSRRKQLFSNVWDLVSENLEGKKSDLFEDIGIESDESVGEILANYKSLLATTGAHHQNKKAKLA